MISGTNASELIRGTSGSDLISAFDGSDTVYGGLGNDTINGYAGNDIINGEAGSDAIFADLGNDVVIYDSADSTVNGGDGNDTLDGSTSTIGIILNLATSTRFTGFENVITGSGNDSIVFDGMIQDNIINTGSGNDTINGGKGNDVLTGGAGSDLYTFSTGAFGNDTITAASNNSQDMISVDNIDGWSTSGSNLILKVWDKPTLQDQTVTLQNWLSGGSNSLTQIQVTNSSGYDMLNRDSMVYTLNVGSSGNDGINYSSRTDHIMYFGGGGNDSIVGGKNGDLLYGNANNNDTLRGGNGDDLLYGMSGNDVLYGDNGNDELSGGDGKDTLVGGSGNDVLNGGTGNDLLEGSSGNDIYYFGSGSYWNKPFGNDTIIASTDNSNDTLKIRNWDSPDYLSKNGNDLMIYFLNDDNTYSSVDLQGWYQGGNYQLHNVQVKYDTDNGSSVTKNYYMNVGDDAANSINYSSSTANIVYYGLGGNDSIIGSNNSDRLYGGTGNDTINSGTGNDFLAGGTGSDRYTFSTGAFGNDTIAAASNNSQDTISVDNIDGWSISGNDLILKVWDKPTLQDQTVTLQNWLSGGSNSLTTIQVTNTSSYDMLNRDSMIYNLNVGSSGNDVINYSSRTNNIMYLGGSGSDSIVGGQGGDLLYGSGNYNDTLRGGNGDDLLYGASGNDLLYGDSGNDELGGGDGKDTLTGGNGNDVLNGGGGNDLLEGSSGNDSYFFGNGSYWNKPFGNDTIVASSDNSNDTLKIRNWDSPDYLSKSGNDLMIYFLNDDKTYSFIDLQGWYQGSNYQLHNIQLKYDTDDGSSINKNYYMNVGDDVANSINYSSSTANIFYYGLGGNDNIFGSSNSDRLYGGNDNDTINGGAGIDNIYGGIGTDLVVYDSLDNSVDGGAGTDFLDASTSTTGVTLNLATSTRFTNFENLTTGSGNDSIVGTTGVNLITAGSGNDTISGGSGIDTIYAGLGNDVVVYDSTDWLIDGGAGTDLLDASTSTTGVTLNLVTNTRFTNFENLTTGSGNDSIVGTTGANRITAGSGNDTITGGLGADVYNFSGNFGKDIITDFDITDIINIIDVTNIANITVTANNGNLTLMTGSNSITIQGWDYHDLTGPQIFYGSTQLHIGWSGTNPIKS